MHDAVIDDLPRTINNVEGWHNDFNSLIGIRHPSVLKFVAGIKKSQTLAEVRIAHSNSGKILPGQRKYAELSQRLKTVAASFSPDNILVYLKNIALIL